MARKKRDYRAEYRRRLELAKVRGLSKAQGRGHRRKGEFGVKEELLLRKGDKRYTLLQRIRNLDNPPEIIEQYYKAKREGFKDTQVGSEELSAKDQLIKMVAEASGKERGEFDKSPQA